jgi:hypothetical protein
VSILFLCLVRPSPGGIIFLHFRKSCYFLEQKTNLAAAIANSRERVSARTSVVNGVLRATENLGDLLSADSNLSSY